MTLKVYTESQDGFQFMIIEKEEFKMCLLPDAFRNLYYDLDDINDLNDLYQYLKKELEFGCSNRPRRKNGIKCELDKIECDHLYWICSGF